MIRRMTIPCSLFLTLAVALPLSAQGTRLLRHPTLSREAVAHFYELGDDPSDEDWLATAEAWRPYRMWASVLLHMAWRREMPDRPSYRQARA